MKNEFGFMRGLATMEYAIVIVCIIAGLLAMKFYITRSMQGWLREQADNIGEQYEAGHSVSLISAARNIYERRSTNKAAGGPVSETINVQENQTGSVNERVGP